MVVGARLVEAQSKCGANRTDAPSMRVRNGRERGQHACRPRAGFAAQVAALVRREHEFGTHFDQKHTLCAPLVTRSHP
jgi:hypothetical protein